jgi:cell division protease FtsH
MIAFLFGGRAAEEVIFGDITTGAGNDIERATDIARHMVCEWGMSEKLGPLAYERRDNPVFLGMQYGHTNKNYSDAKAEEIDKEVFSIVDCGHKQAIQIMKDHREVLERLAQALLEYETIDSVEVDMIVNGAAVSEIRKLRSNKGGGGIGGMKPATVDAKTAKDPVGGKDPVGNPGPATI